MIVQAGRETVQNTSSERSQWLLHSQPTLEKLTFHVRNVLFLMRMITAARLHYPQVMHGYKNSQSYKLSAITEGYYLQNLLVVADNLEGERT